jgi:hypothetical protein
MQVQRVGCQCHTPATFNLRKETWYPLYRRMHWPQGGSGWMHKISPLPGFNPRTIRPVMSCYTYYAVHMCSILSQILRSNITEITIVVNVAKFPIIYSKEMNPYWWYLLPWGRSLQYRWISRPKPQYFLHIYNSLCFLRNFVCFMKGKHATYWSISREYIKFLYTRVSNNILICCIYGRTGGILPCRLHLWEQSLGPPRKSMQVSVL